MKKLHIFMGDMRARYSSVIVLDDRRITDAQLQWLLDKGFGCAVYSRVRFKDQNLQEKYFVKDKVD